MSTLSAATLRLLAIVLAPLAVVVLAVPAPADASGPPGPPPRFCVPGNPAVTGRSGCLPMSTYYHLRIAPRIAVAGPPGHPERTTVIHMYASGGDTCDVGPHIRNTCGPYPAGFTEVDCRHPDINKPFIDAAGNRSVTCFMLARSEQEAIQAPTWVPVTAVTGCSQSDLPQGCAASDYLLECPAHPAACQHEVSGRVTLAGSRHQGEGSVAMRAACSGGGSATTDDTGAYSFVLPSGTCRISVARGQGFSARPPVRTVHVAGRDIRGVDFLLQCGSSGTAGDRAAAAGATRRGCLKVFVKVVAPIAGVGTRSGLSVDNDLPNEGPINFTIGTFSKVSNPFAEPFTAGQRCRSGCANLLIKVIDSTTGKPPSSASVNAALGRLVARSAPALGGTQFLCTQSDLPAAARCGTVLKDLSTDRQGQVHLLYWAPGEVAPAHVRIRATARATCSGQACPSSEQPASATTNLSIKPFVIYDRSATLESETLRYLVAVARDRGLAALGSGAAHSYLGQQLKWLAAQELVAQRLVHLVEGPWGYGLVVGSEYAVGALEAREEAGITAGVLKTLDFAGIGLYDEPFEKQIPGDPNPLFIQSMLNGAANFGHFAAGGPLFKLGKTVSSQIRSRNVKLPEERIRLRVYEISSCNERDPVCGPGYASSPGIRPRLCLQLTWSNALPGGDGGDRFCISQYDALAFAATQPHLNRSVR